MRACERRRAASFSGISCGVRRAAVTWRLPASFSLRKAAASRTIPFGKTCPGTRILCARMQPSASRRGISPNSKSRSSRPVSWRPRHRRAIVVKAATDNRAAPGSAVDGMFRFLHGSTKAPARRHKRCGGHWHIMPAAAAILGPTIARIDGRLVRDSQAGFRGHGIPGDARCS